MNLSTHIIPSPSSRGVIDTEVLPRLRFAESLALRSTLGLDDIDQGDALVAIGQTLAIAGRWAAA